LSARPSPEGQLDKIAPTAITFVTADVYNIEMIGNFIVYFKMFKNKPHQNN
jgi:hypothetical protein